MTHRILPKSRAIRLFAGSLATALLAGMMAVAFSSPAPASQEKRLTVGAAADLQFAFTEIGGLFEQENGARVTFNFGSSGNLAQQIENGAPLDLFASADEEYIQQLDSKELLVPGTQQMYAIGRITLVANKQSNVRIVRLEELLNSEVKKVSLANPDHAPYGRAARQALESAGLWEQLKPKVVYGENVRQALQFVQTGNAEAGIVALSIASVPEVSVAEIDQSLYRPLRQSMAVVKGTKSEQLARDFQSLVLGPEGRPVMERYGFTLPEKQ